MIVEKLITSSRLKEIKPDWDELLCQSRVNPLFASYEWNKAWWESFGSDDNTPFVLVASENNEVAGIAGFYRSHTKKRLVNRTILNVMGQPQADYFDLLMVPEKKMEAANAIFDHLLMHEEWDVLVLENIPQTSESVSLLVNIAEERKMRPIKIQGEVCPYFRVHGSFDRYINSRFSKNRFNAYRRKMKRLGKIGDLRIETLTSPESIGKALPLVADLEGKSWKGDRSVGLFSSEQDKAFIKRVCLSLAEQKKTALHLLRLDDILIAYNLGFVIDKRYFFYNTAYDPDYRPCSPGIISTKSMIEWCFYNNIEFVDLARGGNAYKAIWTDTAQRNVNIQIFKPTIKGRLLAKEWALKQSVDQLRRRNHQENESGDFKIKR